MFSNSFQSGPHLDVFDSKVNKDKNEFYLNLVKYINPNGIKKEFDKETKSYLIEIEGMSRIAFPKDQQKELCLMQRYLVLQLLIPVGLPWSVQLGITDTSKTKRRVMLTSAVSKTEAKFFHVRCPIDYIKRGIWMNLAIDVYSYMNAFKGQTFRSLDQITLGAHCKLRRIFTMKECLIQLDGNQDFMYQEEASKVFVPKQFQLNPDVTQTTQVIFYEMDREKQKDERIKTGGTRKISKEQTRTQKPSKTIEAKRLSVHKKEQPTLKGLQATKLELKKQMQRQDIKKTTLPTKTLSTNSSAGIRSKIDTNVITNPSGKSRVTGAVRKQVLGKQPANKAKNSESTHEKETEQGEEFNQRARNLRRELQMYEDEEFEPVVKHKKSPIVPSPKDPKFATQVNYAKQGGSEVESSLGAGELVREVKQQEQYPLQYQEYEEEYQYGEFEDSMEPSSQEFIDSMDQTPLHKVPDNKFPTSVLTKKNHQTVVLECRPDRVDLVYDPMLECYFNPTTNMYYELPEQK